MALKAGYQGFKDVGDGLEVTNEGILQLTEDIPGITPNPEGEATETLSKIEIEETIYEIPETDISNCYQTTDETESTIVDADYVPFFDSSAASGAGAPRKSTWSNFISKIKSKIGWDYSELEVDTGQKWIDGKTIYAKTYKEDFAPGAGGQTKSLGMDDMINLGIDKIVKIEGLFDVQNIATSGKRLTVSTNSDPRDSSSMANVQGAASFVAIYQSGHWSHISVYVRFSESFIAASGSSATVAATIFYTKTS